MQLNYSSLVQEAWSGGVVMLGYIFTVFVRLP